ncbi:hypothetical protein [Nannocystis pusilla]|uniref:hypothetical protein n=1 Tax=Nannocystis pusilla TaxID=889268 RepID=UPI003B77BBAC
MADMTTMSFMMPRSGRTVAGMTTTKLLAPALLTAAFALACAHGCDGGDDLDNPEAAPDLAGRYVSDCLPSPQADGSTQYLRLDFDIDDAAWKLDYVTHADDACATKLVTVHIEGPYELERPSTAVEGAWRPASASPPRRSAPRSTACATTSIRSTAAAPPTSPPASPRTCSRPAAPASASTPVPTALPTTTWSSATATTCSSAPARPTTTCAPPPSAPPR